MENPDHKTATAHADSLQRPGSADKSSKLKFKVDWFTPFVPAVLMTGGVIRLNLKGKSDAEFIANMFLGALMIYVAFFNLYNVGRRNMRRDSPNDQAQRPGSLSAWTATAALQPGSLQRHG